MTKYRWHLSDGWRSNDARYASSHGVTPSPEPEEAPGWWAFNLDARLSQLENRVTTLEPSQVIHRVPASEGALYINGKYQSHINASTLIEVRTA